ncbi:MAG TPA: flagellar motor protein MotA [Alphaproteobacteria bacterium]|nr:flagellar motor protein MotA [Alphaproteobacteria bacterium]
MRLSRYLLTMGLFLVAVLVVAALLVSRLESAFLSNPFLNALLIVVWVIGIAYIFLQTLRLEPVFRWMRTVQRAPRLVNELESPPLMTSLARLIEDRAGLTTTTARAVLDGIAVRLDESRDTARYFVGLMIFLGLLGTFWGLLKTVGSVGAVVQGLSMSADPAELFSSLKAGLEGPLSGMGTAFGSSLLGLAGSLVLGFLDLQLGQAQNRLFIALEDWLYASADMEGPPALRSSSTPSYLNALVEQTSENIDAFRRIVEQSEESRRQTNAAIHTLSERIGALAAAHDSSMRSARSEDVDTALLKLLERLDHALDSGELGGAALAGQLGAIDSGIQRLADEQAEGRAQALHEIRGEIKLLSKMLGAAIDSAPVR